MFRDITKIKTEEKTSAKVAIYDNGRNATCGYFMLWVKFLFAAKSELNQVMVARDA